MVRITAVFCLFLLLPMAAQAQWVQHDVYTGFSGGYGIAAGDMDNDGDVDIVGCADGTTDDLRWFENQGGGSWTSSLIDGNFGGKDVVVEDFDGDGDLDIAGTSYVPGEVTWWENDNATFTRHDITTDFGGGYAIAAGDIDGDSDFDIVAVAWSPSQVSWFENTGTDYTRHDISTSPLNPHGVDLGDLDNNGTLDIVVSSGGDDNVVWFNNDGGGNFTQSEIAGGLDYVAAVAVDDIDGDGYLDIAAAVYTGDLMVCLMNNGDATFNTILSDPFDGVWNVDIGAVGNDDDMDIVGCSRYDQIIYWEYEGGSFTQTVVSNNFGNGRSVFMGDMDDDGDDDILAVSESPGTVSWFEQPGTGEPPLVELYADPVSPPVIVPQGGSFDYTVSIISHIQMTVSAHVWTEAELPNGQVFGPIDHVVLPITPTTNISTTLTQDIPTYAPEGLYEWRVNLGQNVQNPIFSDSFTFTVTAAATDGAGSYDWTGSGWTAATFLGDTGSETVPLPSSFAVGEAWPNPFNARTQVSFTLPETRQVTVRVYDSVGRLVTQLANGVYSAGNHTLTWQPGSSASGVYFLQVNAGSEQAMRKMVLVK